MPLSTNVPTDSFTGEIIGARGTVVGFENVGLLILGDNGVGKSRLAAEMMALGAQLVGDDAIQFAVSQGMLVARAAPEIFGILELRHMGLIRVADAIPAHIVHLVVELVVGEPMVQLPERRSIKLHGVDVPYMRLLPLPYTSTASLMHYMVALRDGRVLPTDWRP